MEKIKPQTEIIDEGGGWLCNISVCGECGAEIHRENGDKCLCCGAEIAWEQDD